MQDRMYASRLTHASDKILTSPRQPSSAPGGKTSFMRPKSEKEALWSCANGTESLWMKYKWSQEGPSMYLSDIAFESGIADDRTSRDMVSLIPRLSSFAVSGTPARAQVADLLHVLKYVLFSFYNPAIRPCHRCAK